MIQGIKVVLPTHYTSKEGGPWKVWPKALMGSDFTEEALESVRSGNCKTWMFASYLMDRAIQIHAFKLNDGRTWDLINGMREENHE